MELSYKRRVINLDLYGDKIEVSFPTKKQLSDYLNSLRDILDKKTDKTEEELSYDFLNSLGLPKDKAIGMEAAHINELGEILLDQKKS